MAHGPSVYSLWRPGPGVRGKYHRDIAAVLQQLGVPAPRVVIDPGPVRVERLGQDRVEVPVLVRAMAIVAGLLESARCPRCKMMT